MNAHLKRGLAALMIPALVLTTMTQAAAPTARSSTAIQAIPPNVLTAQPRPLVMLNLSKDHQLFYRAYNEFSDYNTDGQPDGTYLHSLRYSGYFDPTKCYTYSSSDGRFNPSSTLVDRTGLCTSAWHGNFLNWATMTRMDILRKVLYGGLRSTDTGTATVLERASLPMDAHSFAKYYVSGTSEAPTTADRPAIQGLTPFNETEITFCNTTLGDNSTVSHTNTRPPLLRAARGNFSLWNSHERRQCRWNEEDIWSADGSPNGNDPARTGIPAASAYPSRNAVGLNTGGVTDADYVVRVAACVSGQLGGERCREYPSGALKPIGLLQEYGEPDLAEFGLMTGSFSRNTSGGVLRKNASSFRNEVNYLTNGTFTRTAGIVTNLDALKVYGFRYSDATYSARDNGDGESGFCAFQTIGLVDNQCASWGNPIGEMFIETLRYLRGGTLTPATAYGSGTDTKGQLMGLTVASWVDPFTRGSAIDNAFGPPACRPINTVNFNASVISYDGDTTAPFGDLGASESLAAYINRIGTGEGIAGTARFVGNTPTNQNSACTAKTLTNLSDAVGLCPAAPAYRGTFSLAGAAYWANTNPIRAVPSTVSGTAAERAFRVRSYGVALAPGVPRITVTTASGRQAVIQPAYRLTLGGVSGSGTMVDFRVIEQTATRGRYIVLWEDSEQGGDYDQDFNGLLEWELNGETLSVTTRRIADSTGGGSQGFGYTISGTNRDGVHFHTGILGFTYTDPTNVPITDPVTGAALNGTGVINASGGCNNCTSGNNAAPTRATYTVLGNPGGTLEDPMWYAAKWGGFRDERNIASGTPGDTSTWDAVNNNTGAAGADGVPDNYSVVFNPEQLEASLRRVFDDAVGGSNSSPAVSSGQLEGGSFKYVASFDNDRLSGNVEAFEVNQTRNFNTAATWNAGAQLSAVAATARQVITSDQTGGFPFQWSSINTSTRADYRALLRGADPTLTDAEAQDLVNFMRGDRSNEGSGRFRARPADNLLGPIVNASPWLQGPPSARFTDTLHPGYSAFANLPANRSRTSLLWVGANDGMLHAFNANTGAPVISYVPEALVARLRDVGRDDLGVQAFADGSPFSADVDVNAGVSGATTRDWRTYVFASLGRGGRGVFALDATNPSTLSQANAASVFRWSFNADDDSDLGHVVSDIAIGTGTGQASPVVKLADGRYAKIFGNGARSTDGRAVLFVLPVQGPASNGSWTNRYHKIVLDAGPNNGLSTPLIVDLNNDGRADTVYAGDLRGNLWKVDISDENPANWRSAYRTGTTPVPLYIMTSSDGTTRLPISGSPQVAFPSFGGQVVTVASGLSMESGDFPRTDRTQRVVGIWDRPAFATGARSLPRGVTTLVNRSVSRSSSGALVASTTTGIDYQNADGAQARDGWYFNLPGSSEMVLSNIGFRAGAIFFTSIRAPASLAGSCSAQPDAALYLFDPISGLAGRGLLGTVDVNGVQTPVLGRNVADQRVRDVADATDETTDRTAGVNPPAGGQTRLASCPGGGPAIRFVGRNGDVIVCVAQSNARLQWREIPGLRTGN